MSSILNPGTRVCIRTVTAYWTGTIVSAEDGYIELADATWIADTGQFGTFIAGKTKAQSAQAMPGNVLVAVGAVVDIVELAATAEFPVPTRS